MKTVLKMIVGALMIVPATQLNAGKVEYIPFGDMNSWITRTIHESGIIGGAKKNVYEIGPAKNIDGNKPYTNTGGSPWGTSNVYAKVMGVTKGSNAVFPVVRSGSNKCAKLTSLLEKVKAAGIINMDVMVAGSMFLGRVQEPISSTKSPYSKIDMGMAYNKRPKNLVLDYKVNMPNVNTRTKSSGFGGKSTLQGHDNSLVFVFLQRRWEDAQGNIHAKRVGTGGELFTKSSNWMTGHRIPIKYGDVSKNLPSYLKLRSGDNAYYAKNSKGKMVKVQEEGWDDANTTPTHVVLMISAGSGEPYVGTEGLTLYVDNVGFDF